MWVRPAWSRAMTAVRERNASATAVHGGSPIQNGQPAIGAVAARRTIVQTACGL